MERRQFCALTGFHPERLKALQHRRALPFSLPASDGRWARVEYTFFRAGLLVAFAELTAGGLVVDRAASLLIEREQQIKGGPLVYKKGPRKGHMSVRSGGLAYVMPTSDPRKDVWFGFADRDDKEEPAFLYGRWRPIFDELIDGSASLNISDGNFGRVFLANFSQAFRTVKKRATELNIEL